MFTCLSFCKLTIAIWFETADFCTIILSSRSIFHKICKSTFSMAAESFCKNQPALRLRENTRVFFCALIINNRQRTVKCVGMIRRIHKNCAIFCIESFIYIIQCCVTLLRSSKTTDDSPTLGIQPHICFYSSSFTDSFTCFCISAHKTVMIPAEILNFLTEILLSLFKILYIFSVLFVLCKDFQNSHCVIEL